jgi:regulator of protease activity HflC (stomatin/prohibitin superfamily)
VRFEQSILPSIVQETLKSVVARYNAEQLLTMREKVRDRFARIFDFVLSSVHQLGVHITHHTPLVTRHTSHVTRHTQVSEQIKDLLTSKAVEMYIAIDDIAITHLVFDEEFTNAIERKQVAQQDVERVKVHT